MNYKLKMHDHQLPRLGAVLGLVLLLSPIIGSTQEEDENVGWDGLVEVEQTAIHAVFINPDADFSVFTSVGILDANVSFRSNWQRDQNRSRTRNIRTSDMERIQEDVAGLFNEVFTERLEAAGYEVVNYTGEDVLVLRPAILDLDITAPDIQSAGRSRTYAASSGAATLLLELFDAASGQIVGRGVDRRTVRRSGGFATVSNRVTNTANARREFGAWADKLIEFLDAHYVKADED